MRNTALIFAAALSAVPAIAKEHVDRVDPKGEAALVKLIGDRVPGKPQSCIQLRDINNSHVIDHTAIVYEVGSRLYVNRPQIGAESLDDDDILVTDTHTDSLCRIDTVKLVDRVGHFERSFVGLGDFIPYSRVKTPK